MSNVDLHIEKREGVDPSLSLSTLKGRSKRFQNFRVKLKSAFNLSPTQLTAGVTFLTLCLHSYEANAFFGNILTLLGTLAGDAIKLAFAIIVIILIVQITMLATRRMKDPIHLVWPIAGGVLLTLLDQIKIYFWK